MSFYAELKRRNVIRAAVLYIGAVWALAQGIAQLAPVFGFSNAATRWFVIAAAIGFPFWVAFSWLYELTPEGIQRESELAQNTARNRRIGRRMDRWIIVVLSVAVVLLGTGLLVGRETPHVVAPSQVSDRSENAPPGVPQKSIAVLPLANEGGAAGEQYFSDGLSENLITALSQFDGLKVIGRNSAFRFREANQPAAEIGRALGVAHLLEGSVRRLGDTVRINATLVRARDGSTVWSQHYDRPYRDLFRLQDEITAAVAQALKARLVDAATAAVQDDRPPGGDLEAYNAYLQGQFYAARRTHEDFVRAFGFFERATQRDSRYARAYAAHASAIILDAAIFADADARGPAAAQARRLVDRALALSPGSGYAHASDARVLSNGELRFVAAEAAAKRAVELDPTADSIVEFALGRMMLGDAQGAEALLDRALSLDPLNGAALFWRSVNLAGIGRLDEAGRAADRAIEVVPGAAIGRAQRVAIDVLRGDRARALADVDDVPQGSWRLIAMAMAAQGGPDPVVGDRALAALVQDRGSAAYQIAPGYALRRDADQVFAWLDTAWTIRDPGLRRLLTDAFIAPYRVDPRFAAFCRKAGLPVPGSPAVPAPPP